MIDYGFSDDAQILSSVDYVDAVASTRMYHKSKVNTVKISAGQKLSFSAEVLNHALFAKRGAVLHLDAFFRGDDTKHDFAAKVMQHLFIF